jgi:nitroreductase
MTAINALLARRSVAVKDMVAPAPDAAQLETILTVATRVPDHGKLCPWRLVVLREEGQAALGVVGRDQFANAHVDATPEQLAHELKRFFRAPVVIAVLSTPKLGTKPVWEQELSAGAVCMNILHAAHALGFGGKWLTEWVAYDAEILKALGGGVDDKIAGFIYIGSKTSDPDDRERPALADVVREW